MSQKGRSENLTYRSVMHDAVVATRKAGGVATDLFRLARREGELDAWEAQCQVQEEWVMSEEAGQTRCHELPGCWTQARSDIRGAFRAGVDFSKCPSYHKMKQMKGKLNAQRKQDKEEAKVEQPQSEVVVADEASDVIVLGVEADAPKEQRKQRPRRDRSQNFEREPKVVRSVEEALADGEVVDAKSNMLIPPELVELVRYLDKLPELTRARLIKRFTKEARDALSLKGQERQRGRRHAAS